MQDWSTLEKLWERHCDPAYQTGASEEHQWQRQVRALYANHIAIPVALDYLLQNRPSLTQFQQWVSDSNANYDLINDDPSLEEDLVLSPEQIAFWQEHGYLVIPNAISKLAIQESCDAIWQFLDADPQNPSTWYQSHHLRKGLMVSLYNQVRLNTNRNSKRIRAAYEQLYGHTAIYKSIDHVSFNPPESKNFSFRGSRLHWDVSLAQPIPERYQGLLYLTECTESDGAFHCVPGFHHQINDWLNGLKPGEDARLLAEQTLSSKAVPGKAGDFVIWHQALPHCATANRGNTPRLVQYLSYIPDDHQEHSVWI